MAERGLAEYRGCHVEYVGGREGCSRESLAGACSQDREFVTAAATGLDHGLKFRMG